MAALNKVFLIGNITRDPELRYATSGTAVVNFSIAVNRFYNDASGEKKQDTCFARVVVWGKQAEACGKYLNKGRAVFVEGRLASRTWTTPTGEKRSRIDVVADRVQFLDRRESVEPAGDAEAPPEEEKDVSGESQEEIAQEEKST